MHVVPSLKGARPKGSNPYGVTDYYYLCYAVSHAAAGSRSSHCTPKRHRLKQQWRTTNRRLHSHWRSHAWSPSHPAMDWRRGQQQCTPGTLRAALVNGGRSCGRYSRGGICGATALLSCAAYTTGNGQCATSAAAAAVGRLATKLISQSPHS